ncbi:MAG: HDOD domain-containing protein [Chromatiales bacterium]|nr:HDOD domain-containing protein [Chromatiales bacterium]
MRPDIGVLEKFTLLKALSREQLEQIAHQAEIREVPAGQLLVKLGSTEPFTLYLIEGTLRLTAADGKINIISSDHPSALLPISQLLPRKYNVVSTTPVRCLLIAPNGRTNVDTSSNAPEHGYSVSGDEEHEETAFERNLVEQFHTDLDNDQLILPSLPDTAVRIGKALRDEITDASQIASIIQTDPVITAKMIKAANSAMYAGRSPVETCAAAVVRLGTDVTHNLVMAYAVGELFKCSSPMLTKLMKELWQHSVKVAAICYVLAKHDSRFFPEQALLIGLLHDIGVVAVLNYAQKFPEAANDQQAVVNATWRLRAQIGSLILQKWSFPTEFIITALEAEDWMRNNSPDPDYCDLVVIAQLHGYIGTKMARNLPGIDEVPAHTKLSLGELTPAMSLQILEESKELLAHAESLLTF